MSIFPNSNTTLVKVKSSKSGYPLKLPSIQIQLLLKLNTQHTDKLTSDICNSNTTLVKVK